MRADRSPVEASRALPLDGLRVMDFGQAIQGPYAGFLLAMAGADVVKIEPPDGEMSRSGGTASAYAFELLNATKRGLVIDLKKPEGVATALGMARVADVVLDNFAPGVLDRLGLGPGKLLDANPRLVYASGTGYGLSGPMRDRVAMDAAVQAVSGLTMATGDPAGVPMRAGLPVADFLAGTHLYAGITTALVEAQRTGRGRIVEVSMLESMFPLQTMNLSLWHQAGRTAPPPRIGNAHGAVGPHNVYAAQDGWVAILCAIDRQWHGLAAAMGRPDLASAPGFATRAERVASKDQLDELVGAWTATRTREEICELCAAHRVPAAAVRDTVEVINDPHLHARGFLTEVAHPALGPVTLANAAMRYEGSALRTLAPAPGLGEHTAEILHEWFGMTSDDIQQLQCSGAVA